MNTYAATEIAYKNGYVQGYKDATAEALRLIRDEILELKEAIVSHDEDRSEDHH